MAIADLIVCCPFCNSSFDVSQLGKVDFFDLAGGVPELHDLLAQARSYYCSRASDYCRSRAFGGISAELQLLAERYPKLAEKDCWDCAYHFLLNELPACECCRGVERLK